MVGVSSELLDDPEFVDREVIEFNLEPEVWEKEYPFAPDWLRDYAVGQVFERLKRGDPGGKRIAMPVMRMSDIV